MHFSLQHIAHDVSSIGTCENEAAWQGTLRDELLRHLKLSAETHVSLPQASSKPASLVKASLLQIQGIQKVEKR